jgi:hypothetical protein
MFRNVMSMSRTEQMRILERDNFTVPYLNSILANLSKPGTANILVEEKAVFRIRDLVLF